MPWTPSAALTATETPNAIRRRAEPSPNARFKFVARKPPTVCPRASSIRGIMRPPSEPQRIVEPARQVDVRESRSHAEHRRVEDRRGGERARERRPRLEQRHERELPDGVRHVERDAEREPLLAEREQAQRQPEVADVADRERGQVGANRQPQAS